MSRSRLTILVVALLVTTASVPAAAQTGSLFGDDVQEPPIVSYGADGHPSFVVSLANETSATTDLQDWADSSESRTLVRIDNQSKTATVAAPRWSITGSLTNRVSAISDNPSNAVSILTRDSLGELSYVQDVAPNYQFSTPEPVGVLQNESTFEAPQVGITAVDDPKLPTTGMAFQSEANNSTMAEVRDYTGADNVSATGAGTTVAVIDTGANTAGGSIFGNETASAPTRIDNASKSFITNESVNVSAENYDAISDANGHGTWVASAVGANATGTTHDGMAPDANLLILKALNGEGKGSTSDIAAAVRYAADNNADVVSMSLGSQTWSQPLADAVAYAYENGVQAVVVAAGNSRQSAKWVASPGDVEGVITVGASNGSAPSNAASAYFSQIGPDPGTTDMSELASQGATVDVTAPGMKIEARTATQDGLTQNESLSGTSMATPVVAGGIATALSTNSTLADAGHETIVDAVRSSAKPAPNMAEVETGHGFFAVDRLANGNHPTTDQSEAMTDPATQRDEFYRALSESSGGFLARVRSGSVGA